MLSLDACRMVVRIMLMVPIYALASLISLFSLDAAFFIDVIRDVYEVCCWLWTHVLVNSEPCFRLSSFTVSLSFWLTIWAANVRFSSDSTDGRQSQPYFLSVCGDARWMSAIHTRFSSLNEEFFVGSRHPIVSISC